MDNNTPTTSPENPVLIITYLATGLTREFPLEIWPNAFTCGDVWHDGWRIVPAVANDAAHFEQTPGAEFTDYMAELCEYHINEGALLDEAMTFDNDEYDPTSGCNHPAFSFRIVIGGAR